MQSMSNENKTSYRIPSLRVILNGTPKKPETNDGRKVVSSIATSLSLLLGAYLWGITSWSVLILPALFTLEYNRQSKIAKSPK